MSIINKRFILFAATIAGSLAMLVPQAGAAPVNIILGKTNMVFNRGYTYRSHKLYNQVSFYVGHRKWVTESARVYGGGLIVSRSGAVRIKLTGNEVLTAAYADYTDRNLPMWQYSVAPPYLKVPDANGVFHNVKLNDVTAEVYNPLLPVPPKVK